MTADNKVIKAVNIDIIILFVALNPKNYFKSVK